MTEVIRRFSRFLGRLECDPWLIVALTLSAGLNLYHLNWGLPAGEHSWAVDATEPVTVLAIVLNSFRKWNSGYFYFKYPLGHPFLQAVTFAPYLAYLFLTGGWKPAAAAHGYGFRHPEEALFVLALLARGLSVVCTVAMVGVTFGIARRLFGLGAARLSAFLVATSYPIVFYAHTPNVDASYIFWLLLALYCALIASETDRVLPWSVLGFSAAMALSTKEQGFGFLLPLPFIVLTRRVRTHGTLRACVTRPPIVMAVVAIVTMILANNAIFNPLGVVARVAFLLGHPLQPVKAPLRPVDFSWFKGAQEWELLRQLWDGFDNSLGLPLALVALAGGLASLVRRPSQVVPWLFLPAVLYYWLSLRGQELINLRYMLPIAIIGVLFAAALLIDVQKMFVGRVGKPLVQAVLLVLAGVSLARGVELDLLLRSDSRYQAEAWMAAHLPAGARGEVYQKQTYLPRFRPPLTVTEIPINDRSIAGIKQRQPDFIVMSSMSRNSVSHVWNPDWRRTGTFLLPVPAAMQFADALQKGTLGYETAAVFRQRPRLFRPAITSLCPEIRIYVGHGSSARSEGNTAAP